MIRGSTAPHRCPIARHARPQTQTAAGAISWNSFERLEHVAAITLFREFRTGASQPEWICKLTQESVHIAALKPLEQQP
jgi:hypothetical protein